MQQEMLKYTNKQTIDRYRFKDNNNKREQVHHKMFFNQKDRHEQ